MITEVENIILTKEYFELTPQELESVSELVQSADEYDEMKWFLASTQEVLVSEKITATPELKQRVMAHLNKEAGKRKFWLNGVGVFLWPTDREFFRRPAFQMSLAALLLIGFLMVYNQDINQDENMAVNQPVEFHDGKETGTPENEFLVVDESKDLENNIPEESGEFARTLPDGDSTMLRDKNELHERSEDGSGFGSPEKSMVVTDYDGYYGETEEIQADEFSYDSNVSNANNNERDNDVSNKKVDPGNVQPNDRLSLQKNSTTEEKLKDKSRIETKGEKEKDDKPDRKYKSTADDLDQTVALSSSVTSSDSVSTATNALHPSTDGVVNQEQQPVVETIFNTATTDGGFGNMKSNDFLPLQVSIQQSAELKKLYTIIK